MKTITLDLEQVQFITRLIVGASYHLDVNKDSEEAVKTFIDSKKKILEVLVKLIDENIEKEEIKEKKEVKENKK